MCNPRRLCDLGEYRKLGSQIYIKIVQLKIYFSLVFFSAALHFTRYHTRYVPFRVALTKLRALAFMLASEQSAHAYGMELHKTDSLMFLSHHNKTKKR